jgi:hypothetical protein
MVATLENRKKNVLVYLADLQDESVLQQIEHLLMPTSDIWDELSDAKKDIVMVGKKQLSEGKKILFTDFKAKRANKGVTQ